ncbi:serine hydrolase [Fulvivirgaceae bacterium PWU4]|uniref:beta-lactamase n=1 Tax=Chryseosolibacter histidini TaxID=2782349 RepID=A0AAP2DI01_9BACT|nr:serine hydrolase [Chryseosolibacter histidini]MBT1696721.1 serine hydrolase [Chryseosolibacter histidini]
MFLLSYIRSACHAIQAQGLKVIVIVAGCSCFVFYAKGQTTLPGYYKTDKKFNDELKQIVADVGLDSMFNVGDDGTEKISLAVIDLNGKQPVFGGVYYDNFIYPASVYKMYVAMEILKQVDNGKYALTDPHIVASPNDVDRSREISFDPRPLIMNNDTVTVNYLLDLMITRSDNSAANCLIDIAGRPNINKTMAAYRWAGSEVTRKFLSRKREDPGYDTVRSTETCALHAADFMYKIQNNQLVSPWVSMQMKALLGRQLDNTKLSPGLPAKAMFYHKTGWWSYYTNDVGIVDDGRIKYVIALFTPVREEKVRPRLKELSGRIYDLIVKRNTIKNSPR